MEYPNSPFPEDSPYVQGEITKVLKELENTKAKIIADKQKQAQRFSGPQSNYLLIGNLETHTQQRIATAEAEAQQKIEEIKNGGHLDSEMNNLANKVEQEIKNSSET